jgi:hypothetical protein
MESQEVRQVAWMDMQRDAGICAPTLYSTSCTSRSLPSNP